MEVKESLIAGLVSKKILVKTQGGIGTKEYKGGIGEYKGNLLGFDGTFLRLEYEVSRFIAGATKVNNEIILINVAYIISVEEYREIGYVPPS